MTLSTELHTALVERREPLDDRFVDQLRKEFLVLMKNLKRVKTFAHAKQLHDGFRVWRQKFDEYADQVREDLQGRVRIGDVKPGNFKPGMGGLKSKPDAAWAEEHIKRMKPVWDFSFEMGSFPLDLSTRNYNYKTDKFDPAPPEQILKKYQRDVKRWEGRTRRASRATWKVLKEIADWANQGGFRGGGQDAVVINKRGRENVSIAGFRAVLVGYDESNQSHQGTVQQFTRAMEHYRKRAARVFPWLLRYTIPIEVHYDSRRSGSASGEYINGVMMIYDRLIQYEGKHKDRVAKTVAHEMGHHIFRVALSGEARKAWESLVRGSRVALDLQDVLARMKPDEGVTRFHQRMVKEDPLLALKIAGLDHTDADISTFAEIKGYLDDGGSPIVIVPSKPISGYANKNPEESFCEVLGHAVAYGPRTVLPEIRAWFNRFVPNVKWEERHSGGWDALFTT